MGCAALLAPMSHASGTGRGISYTTTEKKLTGDDMRVSILFNLDSLRLGIDRQIYLTPVLEGDDGNSVVLPSVLVNGRNMHFAYLRGSLRREERKKHDVAVEVRRMNGKPQKVEYSASVPRASWMLGPDARLRVVADTCGCGVLAGRDAGKPEYLGLNPYDRMLVSYVTPKVTELPVTVHEGRARVQFEVDRTELHAEPYVCRNGQRIDNRGQLRIIDDSVRYALSDPNVEIASISVCGYASPESPYTHNEYLSTARSRALAEYLGEKYNLPAGASTYTSVAENWKEFREMADTSRQITAAERTALLELIDRPAYGASDYDQKERELKTDRKFARLYRSLILPEWFPRLRATTFAISTRLKPMSDEQLAEVMARTPEMMSLNQMMRVARLYPEGSDGFNNAIAMALRYYPDDRTANLNAAVAAIGRGDTDLAGRLLAKAGDTPEAENARGILATRQGDFDAAREHFRNAAPLPEAARNLRMLE